jgi:import inner membrane translocase subunit TIM23
MNTGDSSEFEGDAGAPLPDFSTSNIKLQTIAPALGVSNRQPDYLDYDQKGRGVIITMFANAGTCYLTGISGGGTYGAFKGIKETPSPKFKVKLNSVLNQSGRYGSLYGNMFGSAAVLYSLYQGACDHVSHIGSLFRSCNTICTTRHSSFFVSPV